MKKLFILISLLSFWGCKSDEPDRLIVGEWVLREYLPVTIAGAGSKQLVTDNWWVEKFTRSGKYERIIRDTLRMSADYSVSADGNVIEFNNSFWYERGMKKAVGGSIPLSIYKLDKQTLTYSLLMSEASIYTFHKKKR